MVIGGIHRTTRYDRYRRFNPSDCIEDSFWTKKESSGDKRIMCRKTKTGKIAVQSFLKQNEAVVVEDYGAERAKRNNPRLVYFKTLRKSTKYTRGKYLFKRF